MCVLLCICCLSTVSITICKAFDYFNLFTLELLNWIKVNWQFLIPDKKSFNWILNLCGTLQRDRNLETTIFFGGGKSFRSTIQRQLSIWRGASINHANFFLRNRPFVQFFVAIWWYASWVWCWCKYAGILIHKSNGDKLLEILGKKKWVVTVQKIVSLIRIKYMYNKIFTKIVFLLYFL